MTMRPAFIALMVTVAFVLGVLITRSRVPDEVAPRAEDAHLGFMFVRLTGADALTLVDSGGKVEIYYTRGQERRVLLFRAVGTGPREDSCVDMDYYGYWRAQPVP